jgi:peptide/nickel transport system substrate-binding protein
VIGVRSDVTSFNVYTATNAFSQEIADLLYLRLAEEQDDFASGPPTFRPALARSWELAGDGASLTVHLDPAARWSDGRPIVAADVAFSQRAAADPRVGWVGRDTKEFITAVETPDPRTVVYRFAHAAPYQLMDAFEGNVLPAHAVGVPLERWAETAFLEAPVTSGPFRLVRYERAALIELARSADYLRAPLPHLASVVFRIIPDEDALVQELLSGGIDVMENLPERRLRDVEAQGGFDVVRARDLSYGFVCWNVERPLFSDPRVRRALTLAIDREQLIEAFLPATGRPSHGPVPSALWAHHAGLSPLPYDPVAARALLAEAGWRDTDGDGVLDRGGVAFRFELDTNQESGLRRSLVAAIASELGHVGVAAVPVLLEFGAAIERHERHAFDAFVGSWRESTKVDLKSVFHSASIEGGYNYGSYRAAEVDALIDRARAELVPARAGELWREVQERIARDQPYTFLFESDRLHAVRKGLRGFRPGPRSAYAGLEGWRWD